MAHTSFLMRWLALALATTALVGCSALQIDVDVYKGPLVNRLDVQVRQYAYLVEASKPLVERMHSEVLERMGSGPVSESQGNEQEPQDGQAATRTQANTRPTTSPATIAKNAAEAFKEARSATQQTMSAPIENRAEKVADEKAKWLAGAEQAYGCPERGHKDWFAICTYLQELLAEMGQVESLTEQFRFASGFDATAEEMLRRPDYVRLNEAILHLATKVNFVTAQIKLYESAREPLVDRTADALQALSNILLVHANDIHRQLARAVAQSKQAEHEIDALRAATKDARVPFSLCQATEPAECKTSMKTQMEVLDMLIANLRAQRLTALANGFDKTAQNYLDAINAAFEQRASMIYLRPAGDYLRSVHLASGLQDGPDSQHRNMLNDWHRYTFGRKPGEDGIRKQELDKISWQNINRVTLGGGGATDFVVAKDDVGNWYVKAYSSDPESIIKGATSLALFNAGSAVNVNLMRRYQLQSRIDALPADRTDEKRNLMAERDDLVSQDGRPLLALRERYADRYASATRELAQRVLEEMNAVAPRMQTALGGADACATAVDSTLDRLDKAELKAGRETLETLKPQLEPKKLPDWEHALRQGLDRLRSFSELAARDLPKVTACDASWTSQAANKAHVAAHGALLRLAKERLAQIERYDDALNSVLEVATQK